MNNISKLISSGSFLEAKKLISSVDRKELRNILLTIGLDDQNICAYSFVCFLMIEKETIEYHCLATEVLIHAFSYLAGAYETALYHTRKSIELDPNNIENEAMVLFFHALPFINPLIREEEAKAVALKVLKSNPDHMPAQRVIYGSRTVQDRLEKEKQ